MTDPRHNTRDVRAPRGTQLRAKSWLTEAPLRMLMNNLDPDVAENPNEPKVLFKLEPYSLDSSLGRADFRFGNQQMEYRHGPIVQTAFSWPAESNEGRTSLVVEELGGRKVGIEKNTGPWSLFRLLDLMSVDYHSGRDVLMLKADLGGLRANYLLHSQRSPNPFDLDQLRSFKLPATL